jgi:hypothetical protein
MAYLFAALFVLAIAYTSGRKPFRHHLERSLADAQHEHARWVAICFKFTKAGCEKEAKIAVEQVVVLRAEINFYRRMLGQNQQTKGSAHGA